MILLRAKGTSKTAKAIVKKLRENNIQIYRRIQYEGLNKVLVWGRRNSKAILNKNPIFNKLIQLQIVKRIMPENVPKIYRSAFEIDLFPIVGRLYHHEKGKDLVLIKSKEEIVYRDYYLKYIPKIGEYRVHYCLGDFLICKKIKKIENADIIVRNLDSGWKMITYEGKYKEKLLEFSKRIIDILKYDFGAIDIIMDKNHELYFLEINSAPGLDNLRIGFYVERLVKFLKGGNNGDWEN